MKHILHIHAQRIEPRIKAANKGLGEHSITVFYGKVQDVINQLNYFHSILSEYEQKRASRFVFEKDKNTYIASHGFLRIHLATKLDTTPDKIQITFQEGRKPFLADHPQLDFNLSHSNAIFAFAISTNEKIKVGIDVEQPKPSFDFQSIIENYMHPDEREYILENAVSTQEKEQRFYEMWTRKEALLKYAGVGIVTDLPSINMGNGSRKITLDAPDFITVTNTPVSIHSLLLDDTLLSLAFSGDKSSEISYQRIKP